MFGLPAFEAFQNKQVERLLAQRKPRIAIVKQDTQDDLYCCAANANPVDIIESSLMRTGPAGLFTSLGAEFLVVTCSPEPECEVWKEKATELGWYSIEDLQALRDHIPNRDYGQSKFARPVDSIDWASFDIVISIDIAVPQRIVVRNPEVLWCYYIREPKTSSYKQSLQSPISGYDLFFTQLFSFRKVRQQQNRHCVDAPYYFQYPGWIRDLYSIDTQVNRSGCFLEHHTGLEIKAYELSALEELGSVRSTAQKVPISGNGFYGRSELSTRERLEGLSSSKYYIQYGNSPRSIFGNGYIEAICAGSIALGNPDMHTHRDIFNDATSARNWSELIKRLKALEASTNLFQKEQQRQRLIVRYCCWTHPLLTILKRWVKKTGGKR